MNPHSLKALEFDFIKAKLAGKAGSPYGKESALFLEPTGAASVVLEEQAFTDQARKLLEAGVGFEFGTLRDIRPALAALSTEGALIEPLDLLAVSSHLALARRIKVSLEVRRDAFPLLNAQAAGLTPFKELEERIEKSIEPDGRVSDRASEALGRIRREQETVRQRIYEKLESIIGGAPDSIQEQIVTIREGRYVIPVKSESKGHLKGIVHDTSASGATVFVEPLAAVDLNNRMRTLLLGEDREVKRILQELSALVLDRIEPVNGNLALLARFDLWLAKGQLAISWGCAPARYDQGRYLLLVQARHPALADPVPLDLELGGERTTMVITGPNTGGKTVVLKTLGLLSLMNQSGLQVPAGEGSVLPVFNDVFADIGDEQSISQSLSTFSSHLVQLRTVLGSANGRSLVLLDEIGAGTEPGEGAALAMAILAELTVRGCLVLSTTHYGALKAFVQSQPAMTNAAMEFDRAALRPTYRMLAGLPGASYALEIAARLGIPGPVVDDARARLDSRSVHLEDLISHLEEVKRAMEQARQRAQCEEERARALTREFQDKLDGWRAEAREIKAQARASAAELLAQARSAAEQAVAAIRQEQASKEGIKRARGILEQAEGHLEREAGPGPAPEHRPIDPGYQFQLGQTVLVPSLGKEGQVAALPDSNDRVRVQVGSVRMLLSRGQLQLPGGAASAENSSAPNYSESAESGFAPELHLLGMRADEALAALDKYLDDAVLLGIGRVRIVHGKGTGALRKAVQQALSTDRRIRSHRLGNWDEGQHGVTVAELKSD